jgi:hypothetical protein
MKSLRWLYKLAYQKGIAHGMPLFLEAFAKLIAVKEREAIQELHQHEDVLAPVGNSAWGEAYQEGWASGTRAYLEAIRARGEA